MEITSKRIPATPRSKYTKYGNSGIVSSSNGTSSNVDLSNLVKLKGQTSQTIEGNVLATGDVIAYQTAEADLKLPIASTEALGCIKVGTNLSIAEDGTLNAEAGGGGVSSWNDLTDKPTLFPPSTHTHLKANITDFSHTHPAGDITGFTGVTLDTNQTITGSKTFTKSIIGQADIIAYATGISREVFPIASTGALGCIKVGNNLSIREDGTLDANAGGLTTVDWSIIQNKPSFAAVATSGSYNDLFNKPALFSGSYNDLTNKPTIPTSTSQLTNNSGYITGINLSMWNGAATTSGQKTIGNSGNGSYVDIVEDVRIKQNCTFSSTPNVNGTTVSLSNHSHTYVDKAGDTMTGILNIQRSDSDYSYVRCTNKSAKYVQFSSSPTAGGSIQSEGGYNSSATFTIQVGNSYPNNVNFQGGNINAYGNITAYSSSDKRLKRNVEPIRNSLDLVNKLKPVSFNWNDKAIELDIFKNKEVLQYGLIAQDTETIIPDLVHEQYQDEDGIKYKAIDYVKLVPFLIDCIQDLSKQITKLREQYNGKVGK